MDEVKTLNAALPPGPPTVERPCRGTCHEPTEIGLPDGDWRRLSRIDELGEEFRKTEYLDENDSDFA